MPRMTDQGPTVRQRKLAAELRKLREAAELTTEVAAGALAWPRSKLTKIETARQIPTLADVEAILATYGGRNKTVGLALLDLARTVKQRGWWSAYGDVLEGGYAELEHAADLIRMWQAQVVPGLFQTPAYAREIIRVGTDDQVEIDRRVQARMTRRAMLDRTPPPRLEVVLTEEVLRRPIGGRAVMRGQLAALLEASERPNVLIRVVPLTVGAYEAIGQGNMIIFEFPGDLDLSVAYMETMGGGMYVEDISQVRACSVSYDRICDAALSTAETAALMAATLKELK